MPELPEVETIKKQLEEKLPLTIGKIEYSSVVSSILKDKNKGFCPRGSTIKKMSRHGKMLIFNLEGHKSILSHLGMSGSWRISDALVKEKHTHIQYHCINKDGAKIYIAYIDPRRFGNLYYTNEKESKKQFLKLGVDISSTDFNIDYLEKIFHKFPQKILKPFLLDQKYFAGCGNYIASEICALSGIMPTKLCGEIKKNQYKKIIKATRDILDSQIKNNGLTFSGGYQDAYGDKGQGVQNLVVFHQEICGICKKTKVEKIVLASRGTFYCPKCQK